MAVKFTNVANEYITLSNTIAAGLVQKTIAGWLDLDSFGDTSVSAYILNKGAWAIYIGTTSQSLFFLHAFSTSGGIWKTANATVTTARHHIAIAYDNSSTSNDPVLYIDGVSKAVTESVAPSGSPTSDASANLEIGNSSGKSIDGILQDVRIYNRILTPAEVYALYANRRIGYMRNGLVFHAPMIGAAGLTKFDGSTLGATNYVRDIINNAAGTPVGNPVGRGNTIQRIN